MSSSCRVAVIGAGAIGLSVGWRLAQAGCSVHIYDKGRAGQGASWAAAGMLATAAEVAAGAQEAFELGRRSQELWPQLAAELERAVGFSIDYRTQGTLIPAFGVQQLDLLRETFDVQRSLGAPVQWLSRPAVREREPQLSDRITGAIFAPEDVQVDNRKFVAALKFAFLDAGGRLHEDVAVRGLEFTDNRFSALVLKEGTASADMVIVAAGIGSKSSDIEGLPEIPLVPVQGEMAAFKDKQYKIDTQIRDILSRLEKIEDK